MKTLYIFEYKKIYELYEKYNIRIVPFTNKSLRSIISRDKEVNKMFNQTNAVYEFSCKQYDAIYIDKTKWALKNIKESTKTDEKNTDTVIII